MASDSNAPRSRRALLAAAAGGAAAMAASAALPLTAAADDGDTVTVGHEIHRSDPRRASPSRRSTLSMIRRSRSAGTPSMPMRAALVGTTGDETDSVEDTIVHGCLRLVGDRPRRIVLGPVFGVISPDIGVVGSGGLGGVLRRWGTRACTGVGGPAASASYAVGDSLRPTIALRRGRQGPSSAGPAQEHDRHRQVEPEGQPRRRASQQPRLRGPPFEPVRTLCPRGRPDDRFVHDLPQRER